MTPAQALDNLDRAVALLSLSREQHIILAQSVQVLAPIVAAHDAKAKADAQNSEP